MCHFLKFVHLVGTEIMMSTTITIGLWWPYYDDIIGIEENFVDHENANNDNVGNSDVDNGIVK